MSKKSTEKELEISYTQAMQQLETIVSHLQDPKCDIDLLRDYTKQAIALLKFCKTRLTQTDEELKKLLIEIEND